MLTCPVCRSLLVRRSVRRNILELILSMGGRYPFRCRECHTRFHAFRWRPDSRDSIQEAAESEGQGAGHAHNAEAEDAKE